MGSGAGRVDSLISIAQTDGPAIPGRVERAVTSSEAALDEQSVKNAARPSAHQRSSAREEKTAQKSRRADASGGAALLACATLADSAQGSRVRHVGGGPRILCTWCAWSSIHFFTHSKKHGLNCRNEGGPDQTKLEPLGRRLIASRERDQSDGAPSCWRGVKINASRRSSAIPGT